MLPQLSLTNPHSLDPEMDKLIRNIIRDKFRYHTVITVAHNLENLVECDKVMVIDHGKAVEFDTPENLAAQANSKFNQIFRPSR